MGFLDSLISSVFGSSGGQSFGGGILSSFNSMLNAGLDSLGLSQHGRDQYFARELQWDMLNAQQNFQREQTANQQAFTREMYGQQWQDMLQKYPLLAQRLNDQQFNLWKNQFNLQNAWNSPGNQMALQRAGGINPSLQGALTASNSMGASSAQMPPQISPSPFSSHASPIGLPQGLSGRGSDISEIGQFLKDFSQMQVNQKIAGRYDEKMDADIKSALASAGLAEAQSKYEELLTSVDSFFLPKKRASEVKLNLALAFKAAAEGDEAKSQERLNDALSELNKTKNEEAKARLPFVEMEARANIDDIKAAAAEKRSQAALAAQSAQTEKFKTKIVSIQSDIDAASKAAKLTSLFNELRAKNQISDKDYQEARIKAQRVRDHLKRRDNSAVFREVDSCLDWLKSKVPALVSIGK